MLPPSPIAPRFPRLDSDFGKAGPVPDRRTMQEHDTARRDRLKAALRENLKRRKAQARAWATAPAGPADGSTASDSAPRRPTEPRQED
ncbi:hypothetical protein EV668_0584 [Enterovirga rhinocerotis]|uniref:Uncharacterized protein n=1 Tax=Enterovirga rhinocerotis TaxID=1339210 RepID=A0A4R7C8X4_9HYPH|nr:hypothetical protein EV668_0584 [Enterovirga rhinocerotis]